MLSYNYDFLYDLPSNIIDIIDSFIQIKDYKVFFLKNILNKYINYQNNSNIKIPNLYKTYYVPSLYMINYEFIKKKNRISRWSSWYDWFRDEDETKSEYWVSLQY